MKKKQISTLKPAAVIPVSQKNKGHLIPLKKPWDHFTGNQFPLRAISADHPGDDLWEYFEPGSQHYNQFSALVSVQSKAFTGFGINQQY